MPCSLTPTGPLESHH